MSQLAVACVRGMIIAQVTLILTRAGQKRWCELATSDPRVVQPFLQVFPRAAFVCVHRDCLEVIRAGVAASPWGLQGQGLGPISFPTPGTAQRCSPPTGPDRSAFASPHPAVPVEMIPPPLRQRVSRLHNRLGYLPLPE
jgi:hypothetical protein